MAVQPKDTSRGHFWVSLFKSAIRILAALALASGLLALAGFLFIVAEALGILEELV